MGNHRGTFWLWWNPVREGGDEAEPLGKEFLLSWSPGVTGNNSALGLQCQVHLEQNGPIQKPEHPPAQHLARTKTCGIGKITFQK